MSGECDLCSEHCLDCKCDIAELTLEVRKIYPLLQCLRRNENEIIEFGITTYKGNIEWFHYCQLPYEAEKYIKAWLKLERHL